jgi:hypothetical protein
VKRSNRGTRDLLLAKIIANDQIKFRLSDCVFEYGDFRDEESADKYEGFLVVASSKGDTLSLFEPKG